MLCEKCGTVIPVGSEACPNCGASLPKTIDQTPIPDFSEISSPISEVVPQEEIANSTEIHEDQNHSSEISQIESVETPSAIPLAEMFQETAPVEEVIPTEMNIKASTQSVPEVISDSSSEEIVSEEQEPVLQGWVPLATSIAVEPAPVMEQPVDELEMNVTLQEDNTTWTDEEKPEEKKVAHMPTEPQPVVKSQEPSVPMEKPDLLRGMNEPTPQEYAALEKKRMEREKTNRMVQMINKIALLLVGIVIVGVVGFFGYQYFFVPKDTTQPYSYDAYTFQIDQNYEVVEQENGFVIESKDQSASMSVQLLPDSYTTFESGYLSNQGAFINQMMIQYGTDAVKRVELKNIEGQSFITITRTTETDSSYIIYTTTPDDKIILAKYVPRDQILNQSQADQMSRNLLNIVSNEK